MRYSRQGLKNAVGIAVAAAGLACALLSCVPASARADDAPIVGVVDQARLVKIPDGTETLIIGNSTIADVTLLKQKNLMVLTPKAFGETNFIALDRERQPARRIDDPCRRLERFPRRAAGHGPPNPTAARRSASRPSASATTTNISAPSPRRTSRICSASPGPPPRRSRG